jgi:hypothetical protein
MKPRPDRFDAMSSIINQSFVHARAKFPTRQQHGSRGACLTNKNTLLEECPTKRRHTARHSPQKPQNSQNKTGFLCGFREFCVDRRGQVAAGDAWHLMRHLVQYRPARPMTLTAGARIEG